MRLTGITTPGQSGHVSNGNERVLHTSQISGTVASPSDIVACRDSPFYFLEALTLSVENTMYSKPCQQGGF